MSKANPSKYAVVIGHKVRKAETRREALTLKKRLEDAYRSCYCWQKKNAHIYSLLL